jgi:hypothetical protein
MVSQVVDDMAVIENLGRDEMNNHITKRFTELSNLDELVQCE